MRIGFIFLFILICQNVFSQSITIPSKTYYLVEEYLVSMNRTDIQNPSSERAANGFGFGLHHLFSVDPSADLVLGIEYNNTSYCTDHLQDGNIYYSNADLKYNINRLSIPLGIRYYFGNKVKVFFELGIFLDLNLKSTRKGYGYNSLSGETENIDEEIDIPCIFGFYASVGSEFYISKIHIVIKPEYRVRSGFMQSEESNLYRDYYRLSIGIGLNE